MRRSLAAALLGISLWIGSLAWSGFVMTRTVLDPGRSEAVAETLLENDAVRAQLVANIATGVEAGLPEGVRVDRATLEAGAEQALDSPAVRTLVLDAFVRSHRAFLGEGEAPRSIDGGAFGAAARQSVIDSNPALAGFLPEAPSFEVPLPTERIPNVGPVRRGLLTAIPVLATVAAIGAGLALLVTSDRPGVVRRAGFWAIGLSAFVLVFAFGIPALAQQVAPSQAEVIAAFVAALAEATRGPALVLAGAGVAGVLVSLAWRPAASAITPGPSPAPPPRRADRAPAPARRPRRDIPTPRRRPTSTPATPPLGSAVGSTPRTDVTRVQSSVDRSAVPARAGARWVPEIGWVHEGPEAIPESARWVPGVGYVLDD